jgi:hypothetical protein
MSPDQMYALAKLRMAETEAQAAHARMTAGRRPVAPWHALRARLRRTDDRARRAPLLPGERARADAGA